MLFTRDAAGVYTMGYAWNGLTGVTESPSGAESNKQYADNTVYANLKSAEEFGATIEAFTYPDAFGRCDGTSEPQPGLQLNLQGRETFGFSYRTRVGNDLTDDAGYKIHLVYGADAAPSEVTRTTVNDSPELAAFSWEVTTTPITPSGTNPVTTKPYRPTAHLIIDTTKMPAAKVTQIEDLIYGTAGAEPRLPFPDEIISIAGTGVVVVNMGLDASKPTFVSGTGVITLPSVTGVTWYVNGVLKSSGAQPALTAGTSATVTSVPAVGYTLTGDTDFTFARP
jgi:hypothetical protein